MAVPTEPPFAQAQGYAPDSGTTADVLEYPHDKAYLFHPNPGVCEVVTVTEHFAKILGVDPADYVVPDLVHVQAVPGANGVRGLSDWPMKRLLSLEEGGGFYEIAKHLAMRGTPLLDPFKPIPRDFLPPGQVDGGYLRFTTTKSGLAVGRCHHLWCEYLEDAGTGEAATLQMRRDYHDAWRVWLVMPTKPLCLVTLVMVRV